MAKWQGDAQRALAGVTAVAASARGRAEALKWLQNLNVALGLIQQSLSVTDPAVAADAATRAQQAIDAAHQLQDRLDRVIG